MTNVVPASHTDLLEKPIFAALATVRPDNTVQVNPMWFVHKDGTLRFTHTTKRAKWRNLQKNPSMAVSLVDPEQGTRYLEVRGKLIDVLPDTEGEFYVSLAKRYDDRYPFVPADKADRVILVMSIEHTTHQG